MSAIGGLVHNQPNEDAPHHLNALRHALRIHGNHSSGVSIKGSCGLASQILPITPEDKYEKQPLTEGPFTIIADARLDNREELGAKLAPFAAPLRSVPDSALILRAYSKWGYSCGDHLLGAFTFAIWNESEQTLFLARDPVGEKTVFYHHTDHCFAFASMPKGLFALPWINRTLNEEKLAEFLTLNHSNHTTSFYEGIHRLAPGHCLTLRNKTVSIRKYWELDLHQRIHLKSDEDYVEQGREILNTCIRSSLRSASPVGAMMSGGLDSSIVACIAAGMIQPTGGKLATFTEIPSRTIQLSNQRRYADETPYINAISAHIPNIEPQFIRGIEGSLFDRAEERLDILESPHRNPFNQLWMERICRTAKAQGINVLLSGQSGNLGLSYDGMELLPSLAKSFRWRRLTKLLHQIPANTNSSSKALFKGKVVAPLLPRWLWALHCKRRNKGNPVWTQFSPINPEFAESIDIDALYQKSGFDSTFRISNNSRIARNFLANGVEYKGELNQLFSSLTGVELRDPLGDPRFMQWTLAIPEEQFLSNGIPRWLAKRIGKPLLPRSVLNNRKRGLQAADWAFHFDANRPEIEGIFANAQNSKSCQSYLDLKVMKRLLDSWPGPQTASEMDYRYRFCRGLNTAQFLMKLES